MAQHTARREVFTVPTGLRLSPGAEGIDLEFDGDIVLQGNLHPKLGRVRSLGGDVIVQGDLDAGGLEAPQGTVSASGTLRVNRVSGRMVSLQGNATVDELEASASVELRGNVVAGRIKAESVLADGPSLTARVVEGLRSVRVGRGRVQSDILIAPTVLLDPSATGKIKVVESLNDLGAHAVRGCLRLADLEDMGGNAASFLAERNLKPLSPSAEPLSAAPPPPPPPPVVPAAQPARPPAVSFTPTPAAPPTPAPVPAQDATTVAVPRRSLAETDLRTLDGEVTALDDEHVIPLDPVQQEINQVLGRILSCYAGGELPPAVADLRDWVARRDYAAVRDGITGAWNQLLKFHQKQGMRIQPQVTTNFNQLNSLVRKL